MGRTRTIALREYIDDDLLLQIARSMQGSALHRRPGFLDGPDDAASEDDELFGDHDVRGTDRGFYAQPSEECRTRRVDLRTAADRDPGPLEMEPADDLDEDAEKVVHLRFRSF